MKKISMILFSILLCFSLVACGEKSAMQEATGASAKQAQIIDATIEDAGISYAMVNKANHNQPEATLFSDDNGNVYNLIDKDGNSYFLILDKNFTVMLILDNTGFALYESPTLQSEE